MNILQMTMNHVKCGRAYVNCMSVCLLGVGGRLMMQERMGKIIKIKHKREKVHWLTIKMCQETRSIINSILCT